MPVNVYSIVREALQCPYIHFFKFTYKQAREMCTRYVFLVIFIGSPLALLVELGWSAISSDQTIETPRIQASK